MKKDERKVSGNFGWAGHGDSFGSVPLFSMRVGSMCNDKEAPKPHRYEIRLKVRAEGAHYQVQESTLK